MKTWTIWKVDDGNPVRRWYYRHRLESRLAGLKAAAEGHRKVGVEPGSPEFHALYDEAVREVEFYSARAADHDVAYRYPVVNFLRQLKRPPDGRAARFAAGAVAVSLGYIVLDLYIRGSHQLALLLERTLHLR